MGLHWPNFCLCVLRGGPFDFLRGEGGRIGCVRIFSHWPVFLFYCKGCAGSFFPNLPPPPPPFKSQMVRPLIHLFYYTITIIIIIIYYYYYYYYYYCYCYCTSQDW